MLVLVRTMRAFIAIFLGCKLNTKKALNVIRVLLCSHKKCSPKYYVRIGKALLMGYLSPDCYWVVIFCDRNRFMFYRVELKSNDRAPPIRGDTIFFPFIDGSCVLDTCVRFDHILFMANWGYWLLLYAIIPSRQGLCCFRVFSRHHIYLNASTELVELSEIW